MWKPLITDATARAAIEHQLQGIADALPPPTTMAEHADRALVRSYLAQDEVVGDPDDAAGASLVAAITAFAGTVGTVSLYGGAAQLGWVIAHLTDGEAADAMCTKIDAALATQLAGAWSGDHDLISGLVGIGVYALERGEPGLAIATRVIDHLEAAARPRGDGIAWFTAPALLPAWQQEMAPDGYWNLGVAHGTPGVIAWLARCAAHGVEPARAGRLLDGAVAYLRGVAPPGTARIPSWEGLAPTRRLAWCYGDLGSSLALLSAGKAVGREDWRDEALAMARTCAGTSRADANISDSTLCHGASGAFHLFHRLAMATGEPLFAEAAITWLERLSSYTPTDPQSFLEGSGGVALALHAAISDVDPAWGRMMLVDL